MKIRLTTIKNIDESISNINKKIIANENRIKAIDKRMNAKDEEIKGIDKRIESIMNTDKTKNLTPTYKINKYNNKRVLGVKYHLAEYIDI